MSGFGSEPYRDGRGPALSRDSGNEADACYIGDVTHTISISKYLLEQNHKLVCSVVENMDMLLFPE